MDSRFLVDIDLSYFGKSFEEFSKNTEKIRREYDWVPEEVFKAGRATILEGFFDRPNIYLIEFFRQKYEAQARKNLERSLAKLKI
ncbi:MAG: hypothetical protein Q7J54_03080 [Candidatus Woesearchaeota archaeon]|nr:hypothetical protein [Candidatus Woesearchaeota archaeon]